MKILQFLSRPATHLAALFATAQKEGAEKKAHEADVTALNEAVRTGTAEDVAQRMESLRASPHFDDRKDWHPQVYDAIARDDLGVFRAVLGKESVNTVLSSSMLTPEFYATSSIPLLSLAITNGGKEKKVALWLACHPETDITQRRHSSLTSGDIKGALPLNLARRLGPPELAAVLHERTAELVEREPARHRAEAVRLRAKNTPGA